MNDPKLHILVVDDDRRMTHTLADILTLKGYQTSQAHTGAEALELVGATHFDCVLADICMPTMDGIALNQALRRLRPGLPVILMTAYAGEALIAQGLAEGAIGVLEKPIDIHHLLGFLGTLSEARTIAVVDDDPAFSAALADILERRGYRVKRLTDPARALAGVPQGAQLILLDVQLDQDAGVDLLHRLRQAHPDIPVILIAGYCPELAQRLQAVQELHALACLYKPLAIPDLLDAIAKICTHRLRDRLNR